MALTDMYEVVHVQAAGVVNVNNIFHVIRDNIGVVATTIAEAFEDRIQAALIPLQDDSVVTQRIEVRNIGDPLDFATRVPAVVTGTLVGEPFNSFTSFAIQFNRLRTDMKNGQKRFVVGVETNADGNNWLAGFVTSMDGIKNAILATWFTDALPAAAVCDYVVIKRICTVATPPFPCPSYRLPVNDAELVFYNPVTGISRTIVRSQVSRKRPNL